MPFPSEHPIVGIDEVGRGPLAGPLVACALLLPPGLPTSLLGLLGDSKALSPRRRALARTALLEADVPYGLGACSAFEVDRLNPHAATMLAMERAWSALLRRCPEAVYACIVIDGQHVPRTLRGNTQVTARPKADATEPAVSAASIIAKEARDEGMRRLHIRHPVYGFDAHAGYGTPAHMRALKEHGATRHHRMTFLRRILTAPSLPLLVPDRT